MKTARDSVHIIHGQGRQRFAAMVILAGIGAAALAMFISWRISVFAFDAFGATSEAFIAVQGYTLLITLSAAAGAVCAYVFQRKFWPPFLDQAKRNLLDGGLLHFALDPDTELIEQAYKERQQWPERLFVADKTASLGKRLWMMCESYGQCCKRQNLHEVPAEFEGTETRAMLITAGGLVAAGLLWILGVDAHPSVKPYLSLLSSLALTAFAGAFMVSGFLSGLAGTAVRLALGEVMLEHEPIEE